MNPSLFVALRNILDDQTTHAKVYSSHHYEKQKTNGKDDPKFSSLHNLVI